MHGDETQPSQEYPEQLCREFLAELRQALDEETHLMGTVEDNEHIEWDGRTHHVVNTAGHGSFLDINRDEDEWRSVLVLVSEHLLKASVMSQNIALDGELAHQIKRLVPWELTKITIARMPKANRAEWDGTWRHRATVLQFNDEKLYITAEDVLKSKTSRERFSRMFPTPVRIGMWIFGNAPQSTDEGKPPRKTDR